MKSAVPKAGLQGVPVANAPPLSHIPLPRRKTSNKSDKGFDGDDADTSELSSRVQTKTSLLSSTSFCCAAGQKEDYLPDARIVPAARPPKKRPPAKAPDAPPSTPKSPLLSVGRGLLGRGRKGKVCPDSQEDIQVHMSGNGIEKSVQEDVKLRPGGQCPDNRLRAVDDRRKITPPSPQRRFHKDSAVTRKDPVDIRKYSDDLRKLRKEFTSVPNPDPQSEAAKKCIKHPNQKPSDFSAGKDCCTPCPGGTAGPGGAEVLKKSHESDDFDCPCCDRTSVLMDDGGLSDIGVKRFTSCEVIAPMECSFVEAEDACDKAKTNALEEEVKTAKETLQLEKKKLQAQQDQINQLEEEIIVMQQLRQELEKEKELRKIAEDKLLELLDYEKRLEAQKRENAKTMESKSTQMEMCSDTPASASNSPHLLGYEGRLRKYQNYIAKLENDNLMLVNELKKFKDLSPRSQEEQAKVLVEKLGQMERNNHLQQKQYETCLDEVANKLVQTLLAQKRLEEECKVLHLRVEQLEQENGTLMELLEEDKEAEIEKTECIKSPTSESSASNIKTRKPSYHPSASSPRKRSSNFKKTSHILTSEEKKKDSPKSTNATPVMKNSEPKSLISSPTSPGAAKPPYSSKIPSFSSSTPKPPLVRKKSDMELKSHRNEAPSIEPSDLVPNSNKQSSSSRIIKLPSSSKATSSKRKRMSRTGSPAEKDSKQRAKSSHIRWDHHHQRRGDVVSPLCQNGELSPIKAFPPVQQVWSFNCEVTTHSPLTGKRVVDSIEAFTDKLCGGGQHSDDFPIKQSSSTSEVSTTIEGRTRDEGYSTMSSDLQPDSAADTTISEQEPSATYVVKDLKDCPSDDSVTECLDGSMCSSSDSGFGPLHQVAVIRFDPPEEERPPRTSNELPKLDRKQGTVKSKEQIASVKPTVRPTEKTLEPNPICDSFPSDTLKFTSSKSSETSQDFGSLSPSKLLREKTDPSSVINHLQFPKELLNLTTNYRKTWHLGPTKSIYDDKIVFCTRHSYIEDNFFDEKIETAEKATLTEPEEELWREKALAPFIDESIWSLYSSEGDIQVKHFPLEPLLSEPSLEKLISNCNPCIVVTENIDQKSDDFGSSNPKSSNKSSATDLDSFSGPPHKFRTSLERVASDSVLYLKDAIYELENSMRRGLKSSKNIPALHQNSGSESEASPTGGSGFRPELLKTLEATMSGQNHLAWPSPTRSSSTSSLQSSTSCHIASDDMEDVEMIRTSRKGSQDPDLNSASDAEYENLEHKDYVERWLQKEIVNITPKTPITTLEPVEEISELSSSPSVRRKTSLPFTGARPRTPLLRRKRYLSFPTDPDTPAPLLSSPDSINPPPPTEDPPDEDQLDPEAKEFNGDFYTLCSIGSLKSLDHGSPVRSFPPKPTVLVKPTRPVTLAVANPVPKVPKHSVPFPVSLPKSSPKVKSPTKIIIQSSGGEGVMSRKQQWRRDKLAARQNRVKEGCGTAWVHLQANPELSDPNLRINLLDSIKAPSSSSGSSSNDEEEGDVLIVQTNSHLHRICKERRQKAKAASANNPLYDLRKRTSIMGRRELFYRFGDKEKEAIACFDFLEELPSLDNSSNPEASTTPPSTLKLYNRDPSKERISFLSPATGGATRAHHSREKSPFSSSSARRLRLPNLWNQPLSHNMSSSSLNSQDCEILDHISLSDSCAESYSSTPESYDDVS